jgi:hypothetical protein
VQQALGFDVGREAGDIPVAQWQGRQQRCRDALTARVIAAA